MSYRRAPPCDSGVLDSIVCALDIKSPLQVVMGLKPACLQQSTRLSMVVSALFVNICLLIMLSAVDAHEHAYACRMKVKLTDLMHLLI